MIYIVVHGLWSTLYKKYTSACVVEHPVYDIYQCSTCVVEHPVYNMLIYKNIWNEYKTTQSATVGYVVKFGGSGFFTLPFHYQKVLQIPSFKLKFKGVGGYMPYGPPDGL